MLSITQVRCDLCKGVLQNVKITLLFCKTPQLALVGFKVGSYLLNMNPLRRSLRIQVTCIEIDSYCISGYIYELPIPSSKIGQIQAKLRILEHFEYLIYMCKCYFLAFSRILQFLVHSYLSTKRHIKNTIKLIISLSKEPKAFNESILYPDVGHFTHDAML